MSLFTTRCQRCGTELEYTVGEDGVYLSCQKCGTSERFEEVTPTRQEPQAYNRPVAFTLMVLRRVMAVNKQLLERLDEMSNRLLEVEKKCDQCPVCRVRRWMSGL